MIVREKCVKFCDVWEREDLSVVRRQQGNEYGVKSVQREDHIPGSE